MSKNAPNISGSRCSVIRPKDSCKWSLASKLKFNSLVINSILKFADNETEHKQKASRKSCDAFMDTLICVERDYVRSLLTLKKSTNNTRNLDSHQTPERKPVKRVKKRKSSIDISKHIRKISLVGKHDSNCNSPFSDKISRLLFWVI